MFIFFRVLKLWVFNDFIIILVGNFYILLFANSQPVLTDQSPLCLSLFHPLISFFFSFPAIKLHCHCSAYTAIAATRSVDHLRKEGVRESLFLNEWMNLSSLLLLLLLPAQTELGWTSPKRERAVREVDGLESLDIFFRHISNGLITRTYYNL